MQEIWILLLSFLHTSNRALQENKKAIIQNLRHQPLHEERNLYYTSTVLKSIFIAHHSDYSNSLDIVMTKSFFWCKNQGFIRKTKCLETKALGE